MPNIKRSAPVLIILAVLNLFIWQQIVFKAPAGALELYFFDVGQGDSGLIILPGNVKILVDGGPSNKVIGQLEEVMSPSDRYIDLVMLSHPQLDHFSGLIDVLKRYEIGAFIFNGQAGSTLAFNDLEKIIEENKIKTLVLSGGDKISHQDSEIEFLFPNKEFLSGKDLNDTSLTFILRSQEAKAFFGGDIGFKAEKYLMKNFDINVDILKVSHHGSKYSSSEEFLEHASPLVSVIDVGKNSYGHPTNETLSRLAKIGSLIFRTDKDNLVKLTVKDGALNIFKNKIYNQ
ncbi:MAG: MBL fold metallo-hydrolase [Patescibacteria group bacterium]